MRPDHPHRNRVTRPAAIWAGEKKRDNPSSAASRSAVGREMEVIRKRFRAGLLAAEPGDIGRIRALARSQLPEGGWRDIDYANNHPVLFGGIRHLQRLEALALACAAPASSLYGDPVLLDALKRGIDRWNRRPPRSENWWYNQIGSPRLMANILLLAGDRLSAWMITGALDTVHESYETRSQFSTGQNLVWKSMNDIAYGCLAGDPVPYRYGIAAITGVIRIGKGEGIQRDLSFQQHGPQFYIGGYGFAFIVDVSRFAALVRGTSHRLTREKLDMVTDFFLKGHCWMLRNGVFEYSAIGREIGRNSTTLPWLLRRGLAKAAKDLALAHTSRAGEMRAMASRLGEPKRLSVVGGNRHYWKSDFMAHHRGSFYTSVKMRSKRIYGTETGNGEGLRNWYMGTGVNFVVRHGREYGSIFPLWNWRQLPGTTIGQEKGSLPLADWGREARGKSGFVGGVSDGTFGLACYNHNLDGVTARKAWLMLDDGFICLGAGIRSGGRGPVLTTLNQCWHLSKIVYSEGGRKMTMHGGTRRLNSPDYVFHDGIGYVFLEKGSVILEARGRTGSWHSIDKNAPRKPVTGGVFMLAVDHGRRPAAATYAYAVLPGTTAAGTGKYSGHPPVSISANTRYLQAVHSGSVAGMAFHRRGIVELEPGLSVSADLPCLVLLRKAGKGLVIAVSNPLNTRAVVNLEINRLLSGRGAKRLSGRESTRIRFELPDGLDAGRSVIREFKSV